MTLRALTISAVLCAALIAAVAAFTDLSLGRAAILAPVLVVSVGAIAFLLVLWGKVAYESLRSGDDSE